MRRNCRWSLFDDGDFGAFADAEGESGGEFQERDVGAFFDSAAEVNGAGFDEAGGFGSGGRETKGEEELVEADAVGGGCGVEAE
jgi:hypothetical protein